MSSVKIEELFFRQTFLDLKLGFEKCATSLHEKKLVENFFEFYV